VGIKHKVIPRVPFGQMESDAPAEPTSRRIRKDREPSRDIVGKIAPMKERWWIVSE